MTRPMRRNAGMTWAIVAGAVAVAGACGTDLVMRAYLSPALWRPTHHYSRDLGRGLPKEKSAYAPYAGFTSGGNPTVARLRLDYQSAVSTDGTVLDLTISEADAESLRKLLAAATPSDAAERHELDLLRCKIDLRVATTAQDDALAAAQKCFESFLRQQRPAALASEGRGWLARAYYLRGNDADAARIYLDELASPSTNIRRARLTDSLRRLYRKPGRSIALRNDLDRLLDTPAHALYAADRVTNLEEPESGNPTADLTKELIAKLTRRADLFRAGPQSDALATALMRAALRIGDGDAVLRFAERIPEGTTARSTAEYLWLTGCARYLRKEYELAAQTLRALLDADDADGRQKIYGANALIDIYRRLDRPADALWAAFEVQADEIDEGFEDELREAHLFGLNMDAAFMLDAQLTDDGLKRYLELHGGSTRRGPGSSRQRPPASLVRYALAVRHARREEYAEAAAMYADLQAWPRARRMREAARLYDRTRDPTLSGEPLLQARYDYASFLADNSTGIFFNDSLWHGFQAALLMPPGDGGGSSARTSVGTVGPEDMERAALLRIERTLRDQQEEHWRAYQILDAIVEEAGRSAIGRRAARKAIVSLRRINTSRFGRASEIQAADTRLSNWLAK